MTRSRIFTVQGELNAEAAKLGLRVFSYAPGDGSRRYRLALALVANLAELARSLTATGKRASSFRFRSTTKPCL